MTMTRGWLVILLFFNTHLGIAQDGHYNGQQPDSKGTLNGGAGTAGSRDLSAVYYNPATIVFFEKSSIGLNGSLFTYDYAEITDDLGLESPLDGSNFFVSPSLFAGTFKLKGNDRFTASYAYFNTGFYNNRLASQQQLDFVFNGEPALSILKFDQSMRYSEDWVGGGLSYRINEHWGIGLIPYIHLYSQQFMQRSFFQVVDVANTGQVYGSSSDFREARLFSTGMVFNFGIAHSKGEHEFGLSIISPRINFPTFSWSYVERKADLNLRGETPLSAILIDDDFRAIIHRPLEINFGYAWMHANRAIMVRLAYYAAQKSYIQGRESSTSFRTGFFTTEDVYNHLPVANADQVFNVGMGYEWHVGPSLTVIGGIRTDFAFFDRGIYRYTDFATALVIWNIYHISGGVDWQYKRIKLQTGVDYGFSYEDNLPVFASIKSLTLPIQEIELSQTAQVNYQQFKVFLGLVLSFE
jgi:hypothetical protein